MATAATPAVEASAPAKGKKKLIIIIVAAVLLLVLAGGAALLLLKKKPADGETEDGEAKTSATADGHDAKAAPVFVALENFTVNLADRQAERYAQVGITLELEATTSADQIKLFMPAIRNNILMAISDRTAPELVDREGKTQLAARIRREASRALGVAVEEEAAAEPEDAEDGAPKKKKRKKAPQVLPIKAVHFSTFIIQ